MAITTLNITLSLGQSYQTTLDGIAKGAQATVKLPNDTSALLTITSSASNDNGASWHDFDNQGWQGGPVNVAKGGTDKLIATVRIPDAYNIAGNKVKFTATRCTGTWVLVSAGTI